MTSTSPLDTEQLLDVLYEELGLDLLEPEEREDAVTRIGEVIFEGVMLRVFDRLDDEKRSELMQLFDTSNTDPDNEDKRQAIQDFMTAHVPEFETFVQEEIEALKHAPEEILSATSREKGQ